jgi:hypothetical protein
MPDLVQVANDLKDMPDQWLAQQMQQPSGSVPPWLVASEMARRERLRSGATRAQAPTSSVSQDLIKSLYARIPPTAGLMPQQQPPGAVPPGMPPVNLTPGGSTFGGPTPGTPPANFRMPARTMAEGGEVDNGDDGDDNAMLQAINAMRQSGGDTPLEGMPPGAGGSRLLTQPTRQSVVNSLSPAFAAATQPTAATAPVTPVAPGSPYGMRPESIRAVVSHQPSGQPIAPGARDQKGLLSFARKQGAIDGYIDKYSAQFGVSPEVIRAMVTHESGRDQNAVSKKGALGLMQLMPATAKQLGVNPLNPEQNIKGGTQYYAQLLDQFGDQRLALAAYNAGPGRVVQNGNQVPTYTEPYVNNVLNTANALRVQSGLPPLDKLPVGDLASRLLQPTPQPGPGQTVASTTTTESPEEEAGTTSENEAALQNTAANANSPAPPTPLAARLQGSIWRPPEPEDLKYAKKREADLQTQTDALLKNFKAYDPDSAWSQDAVDKTKSIVRSFLGAPPDDTRWTQAMQTLMGQAQEMMHPSFGNALIQFGAGLMASRSHNFGVAVGEASLLSMGQQEKEQQQGRALFLQAMNAGIHLQDRTNAYQEKLGQLAFEVQRSQQTGNIDEEKRQLDVIRATQKELQDAHKDRATAQTAYDKTMSVPYATQMQAEGLLAQHPEIPRDPNLSPQDQIQRDAPQLLPQLYPGKAPAKPPAQNEQYLETAVRQTAAAHNLKLPDNPTLASLPLEFQQEAIDLNSKYGAGRSVATEQGKADLVSPEAIEMLGLRALNGETVTSRNPLLVAKANEWAFNKAKEMGMTGMQLILQQNMVKSNKLALGSLTKNIETIEPFITLADRNADVLKQLATKIPDYGAPVWNTPLRDIASRWQGDPNISAFYAQLITTQNELARVLGSAAGSGVITNEQRLEMQKALDPNATPQMIQAALQTLQNESHARREIYRAQQADLAGRTVVGQTDVKKEPAANQNTSATAAGPLPATLSAADKDKIYLNRQGQKVRITDVDPTNPKRFKFEVVP